MLREKKMGDLEWSQVDLRALVENIQQYLPKGDAQTFQTTEKRLPWEKIKFDSYTAKECQEKWTSVASKLRRFRTMTEMVGDALDWVEHPWQDFYKKKKSKSKNPLLPTKPLGIYIRFFKDNREKVAAEYPGAANHEVSKIIGGMFNSLNDKKKAKLQHQYNRELEDYKEEIVVWKEVYPEDIDDRHVDGSHAPKLPTARGLFVRQKLETCSDEDLEVRRQLAHESFNRYNDLKEKKRLLWDEQLESLRRQYLNEYADLHPDDLPPHLRKTTVKAKGAVSGYNLFTKETMAELMMEDMSSSERLSEISRRWRALSPSSKARFNDQAKSAKDSQQEEEDVEEEDDEDEDSEPEISVKKPSQPVNAMFIFLEAKTKLLKEKEPDLSDAEVRRLLVHAFNKLPERKKLKYEEMAKERKQQQQPARPKAKAKKTSKAAGKKAPQKVTAYNKFCQEKSRELSDSGLSASERMSRIVALWKSMTAEEKAKYGPSAQSDSVTTTPTVSGSKRKQASPTKVVKKLKEEADEESPMESSSDDSSENSG